MNGLRYHYSNPKFAGLPWAVDAGRKKTRPQKSCVKKPFSQSEAQNEVALMRAEHPDKHWYSRFCAICDAHHIERERV